jgi:hypothetical protein
MKAFSSANNKSLKKYLEPLDQSAGNKIILMKELIVSTEFKYPNVFLSIKQVIKTI